MLVAAARKRSHQRCLTLTPNNTETIDHFSEFPHASVSKRGQARNLQISFQQQHNTYIYYKLLYIKINSPVVIPQCFSPTFSLNSFDSCDNKTKRTLYMNGTVIQKFLAFLKLQKILGNFCSSEQILYRKQSLGAPVIIQQASHIFFNTHNGSLILIAMKSLETRSVFVNRYFDYLSRRLGQLLVKSR